MGEKRSFCRLDHSLDGQLLVRESALITEDRGAIITLVCKCLNLCYYTIFAIIYGYTNTNETIFNVLA